MSVGIKPNTEMLLNKGAQALPNGALIVNEKFETSLPHIYAAGDNASILNLMNNKSDYMPLGTHSNKGGRAAAINATGNTEKLFGGYKTAIIKLFDHTLARTGCGPRELQRQGIPFKKNLVVVHATPGYYPDPSDIILETYYHAEEQTLLGAELFGQAGVDKRVDVLSTAIYAKLKITDLAQLDLAYAPPFSPAKDPVVVSGHMAENTLRNEYDEISAEELHELISENTDIQLIDVRTKSERVTEGFIPGSVNLPLDNLRDNLELVSRTRSVILHCSKGLRGYLAYRILKQNGFQNVRNLGGGYKVWEAYQRQHPVSYSRVYELI
jgi:rhodanese-related sulfurtransferase